jgi:hypothetical protein
LCIDPANTGKYAVIRGELLFDGFPVEGILEKSLKADVEKAK